MVKKIQETHADEPNLPPLASTIKDSAQQIWLAGLGAFAKAQEEGSKVFDLLVKEGLSIQRKTQAAAEEKMTQAASQMSEAASDFQSRAGHPWDRLENIFEQRVAKAMGKLGMPSAAEWQALTERVSHLEQRLQARSADDAAPPSAGNPAAKAASPAEADAAPGTPS